ncbi:ankyrin repeat domain-containing protein [Chitinophaga solisilvae]|uniref:ankyrin repeat domain-containing protein n=1 Tax=Chitinophaga solisilvae TaxID=1233460 RepID=UPI00136FE4D8|nr:hypothetical protein [Chitinophaga solisilvae]
MNEVNALHNALRSNRLDEARQRMEQGEKLPKDLAPFDKSQIYDVLARTKAYDLIDALIKDRIIETDIYEYEKLDGSIFEVLFRNGAKESVDLAYLESLLGKLDNINDAVQDKTLLGIAFQKSAPLEYIQLLADAGCNIRYKNNYEQNYLYLIAQEYAIKEDTGIAYLQYLLDEGLDPNEGNIVGETALHLSLRNKKNKYTDLLLERGADPNQPGKDGESAFYQAIVHYVCDAALYEKLTTYAPADFNAVNKNGETLLCGALRMRRRGDDHETTLIKALIRDGADVYQTSPWYQQDKAALDWVTEYPADMLQAILDTGVIETDRRDNQGNTLLHKVCGYNVNYDQEAARQLYRKVKLLLEHGADSSITNDADQLPMDLAAQDNLKSKTVELLLKNKA